ncbi:MAG: glycosyltransferase [Verrucomicrobiae bacterium]|nr:glycosyltransferase [Verrucomicrobiae bacterium]
MQLLILIPAYNEAQRIGKMLTQYISYFRQKIPAQFEVLVVLNGCVDNTREIVEQHQTQFSEIQWVEFPKPIGKGGALIEGLKEQHRCEFIGYVDADGATPPEAFYDLFLACQNVDAVIGSRWVKGAKILKLQSKRRRFASRCFHYIVRLLFQLKVKDTQCGAKVLRSSAVATVQKQLLISDMAFDVNLLFALKQAGYSTREIPTTWTDQSGSTVHLARTSLSMLLSIIRLRLLYSPARYLFPYFTSLERWIYKRFYR